MSKAERASVYAALLAVQVMFGLHYLVSKVLLDEIQPAAWAVLRAVPAALILLVVYVWRGPRTLSLADLARLALFALFGVVLNQVCFVEGLARTTPAHSALINTTIPVTTILFAALLRREKVRWRRVAGILSSFVGVLILFRIDDFELRAEWLLGDLLTQANAASFGFFLVISRNLIRRVGATTATTAIFCFGAFGISLYGAPAVVGLDFAAVPARIWGIAAFIIVFPTVLTYFLNYWALARVESSLVALFIYLQPLLATALSAVFLDEPITLRLVLSSLFVFAGVFLATWRRRRPLAPSSRP